MVADGKNGDGNTAQTLSNWDRPEVQAYLYAVEQEREDGIPPITEILGSTPNVFIMEQVTAEQPHKDKRRPHNKIRKSYAKNREEALVC